MGAKAHVPQNKEMQRTKHGPNGASPLISVFDGRLKRHTVAGNA